MERKKISDLICEEVKTNNDLSLDIAKFLDIQQFSVKELAKRKSDKLAIYQLVEHYKKLGFTLEQIFDDVE